MPDMSSDKQHKQEANMLRKELEMLISERTSLLKVVGAAAVFVANMDSEDLPVKAIEAADLLSTSVNDLSEESLKDALETVHAEVVRDHV